MVISAPTLRPRLNDLRVPRQPEETSLAAYLAQVNQALLNQNFNVQDDFFDAANILKQTLVRLEVAQIKQTAISQQVRDFYPSNDLVVERMIQLAQLKSSHRVLEPSAGAGDLASAIARIGANKIDCFELHPMLRRALEIQGFDVLGDDFLATAPQPIFDRVVANPPFGKNGVAHHTQHAFNFLRPGGRLITLGHHYQLEPSKTDKAFFDWLKQHNARFLNLGNAFKNSDRSTNISLQIIVIDKV